MALPTPVFPALIWDGNEQSTAKDDPGNATKANGDDYNRLSVEVQEIEKFLRLGYVRKFVNRTGAQLDKGTLVFISGRDTPLGLPKVTKSQADDITKLAEYVVLTDTANDAEGSMVNGLVVSGINTSGFTPGSLIFLSVTPGAFQDNAAVIAQPVGRVVIVGASGEIEFLIRAPTFVDDNPKLANITHDNEGDTQPDTFRFTLQVQNALGKNLAKRSTLFVYVTETGASAFGDPGTITTLTAATGTDIAITLARSIMVITDANGQALIDAEWTGVGTRNLVAGIGSSVKSSPATWS